VVKAALADVSVREYDMTGKEVDTPSVIGRARSPN
jgi:hypothetical protein